MSSDHYYLLKYGLQNACRRDPDMKKTLSYKWMTTVLTSTIEKHSFDHHRVVNPCRQFQNQRAQELTNVTNRCEARGRQCIPPLLPKSSFELIEALWKGNIISHLHLILASTHQSLQFSVIPPLDTSLRPPRKHLLHPSPMFPMLHHKPANLQIFLEGEFLFADLGTEVIQVPFSNLLGCEFCITGKVLGILELISFHFSPSFKTRARTASSYEGDQALSLLAMEMRRQREQHMFCVLPVKCVGIYFHSNFQTSTNLDRRRSYQALQWVFLCCWAEACNWRNLDSIISHDRQEEGFQHDGEVEFYCGSKGATWRVFCMGQARQGMQCAVGSTIQGTRRS